MAADDGDSPPSATVYVHNLDERIKIPALIANLRELFEEFGEIIDVVAKKNLKAKGQAFIVYDSPEAAQDAIDTLQGFDLGSKPMRLAFAKTRSNATIVREEGEEALEEVQRERAEEKARKAALEAAQKPAKRPASELLAERPAKSSKSTSAAHGIPADLLPPNKTLFVEGIPEGYGKNELEEVFTRFAGFQGVRYVPQRKLAFVDFEDAQLSTVAKDSTIGLALGEQVVKITFMRS